MSYEWNLSAKGNLYTKLNDNLCVVGKSQYGWWTLVNNQFIEGNFLTVEEAKKAGIEALNGKAGGGMEWANDTDN